MKERLVTNSDTCLDVITTRCLKGILACMVLLSHLHGRVDLFDNSILGTAFSAFGYLAVSVFFFLSGYGLKESSNTKKDYINFFLSRKVLPYFCICCVSILIYFIRDIIFGNEVNILDVIQSFLFAKTIVDNGWYLQAQLVFYLLFYITYRFGNNQKDIILLCLIVTYCIVCYKIGLPTTWYEASLCFPFGVLYAKYKDKVYAEFMANNSSFYWEVLALFLGFLGALYFGNKALLPEIVRIIVKMLSALLFSGLVVLGVQKINIKNLVTRFLGEISLEIYVLQGLFLSLFSKQLPIEKEGLYIAAVTISTITCSIIFHPLFKAMRSIGRR